MWHNGASIFKDGLVFSPAAYRTQTDEGGHEVCRAPFEHVLARDKFVWGVRRVSFEKKAYSTTTEMMRMLGFDVLPNPMMTADLDNLSGDGFTPSFRSFLPLVVETVRIPCIRMPACNSLSLSRRVSSSVNRSYLTLYYFRICRSLSPFPPRLFLFLLSVVAGTLRGRRPIPKCCRYLDLLAHYQVKRWLLGQPTLDGSLVMAQVEAGDGAVQTANMVRWGARVAGRGYTGGSCCCSPAVASVEGLREVRHKLKKKSNKSGGLSDRIVQYSRGCFSHGRDKRFVLSNSPYFLLRYLSCGNPV